MATTSGNNETTAAAALSNNNVIEQFIKSYNTLAAQAARAENENNSAAADLHIHLSGLIAHLLRNYGHLFSAADVHFLRSETVARCMQALLLRSMELSGFGDLALSLSATRNLNDDITNARRRIEEARGGGDDPTAVDELSDPRSRTNGLYEYIPYERIDVSLGDLPGYEEQHRRLMHAYYILDTSAEAAREATALNDATIEGRRSKTRAGANAILYGPPGTGKTAAARAVAASLKLDFAFVNAENLLSAYRSETEKNLRILYNKMRLLVRTTGRNVVLLLDEVDGLVKNRRSGEISSGDYSLLTRFLTILEPNDGSDNYGIFSVFTTNRLNNLDDAFRRRCVSIFFGSVKNEESRIRLFHRFLDDTVSTSTSDETSIARLTAQWVPGDYARFKRDVAKPLQLNEYLRRRNITMDDFYATYTEDATIGINDNSEDRSTAASSNRRIFVDLPLLSYSAIEQSMMNYQPVTPFDKYLEDYGVTVNGGYTE